LLSALLLLAVRALLLAALSLVLLQLQAARIQCLWWAGIDSWAAKRQKL
jgi:hypothetical protein